MSKTKADLMKEVEELTAANKIVQAELREKEQRLIEEDKTIRSLNIELYNLNMEIERLKEKIRSEDSYKKTSLEWASNIAVDENNKHKMDLLLVALGKSPFALIEKYQREERREGETYDLLLYGHGEKKIATIKAIREVTGKGLIEAKELSGGAPSYGEYPVLIKSFSTREEAEKALGVLSEASASVSIRVNKEV